MRWDKDYKYSSQINAKRTFPKKSIRFRCMTPIYQAQSWKVIRTNKPHKRTRKNVLIPLISFHIKKTQLHHNTPICRGTKPPSATYIFSALSLPAVSMHFLAHLWLAKWSLHYISYKHLRFESPEYYPRTALLCCRLASLASSLGWLVGNEVYIA